MELLFSNLDWLKSINDNVGKLQIILAGKAHPQDEAGKKIIKHVFEIIKQLKGHIEITYVPNYDMDVAKKMIAGVDLWVNTPLKPNEASGTSGMKAALNGVPQLSVLDGWWIEGCLENVTGWGIGTLKESSDEDDVRDMYTKLEKFIVPTFYDKKEIWLRIMKQCIALNGSYFNTHRMVREYVLHAYFK
jgi:starch phosphorylase